MLIPGKAHPRQANLQAAIGKKGKNDESNLRPRSCPFGFSCLTGKFVTSWLGTGPSTRADNESSHECADGPGSHL